MELKVRKFGHGLGVTFPASIARDFGLEAGRTLTLTARDGELTLVPKKLTRPTLAELLASCDPNAPLPAAAPLWANSTPAGTELW